MSSDVVLLQPLHKYTISKYIKVQALKFQGRAVSVFLSRLYKAEIVKLQARIPDWVSKGAINASVAKELAIAFGTVPLLGWHPLLVTKSVAWQLWQLSGLRALGGEWHSEMSGFHSSSSLHQHCRSFAIAFPVKLHAALVIYKVNRQNSTSPHYVSYLPIPSDPKQVPP